MYVISKLDHHQLEAVREMESRLGKPLLALSEVDVRSDDSLTESEIERLQSLEDDLGVVLVAVKH